MVADIYVYYNFFMLIKIIASNDAKKEDRLLPINLRPDYTTVPETNTRLATMRKFPSPTKQQFLLKKNDPGLDLKLERFTTIGPLTWGLQPIRRQQKTMDKK